MSELEGMKMEQSRERFANEVDVALAQSARPFAIHNARKVDARGVAEHYWLVSDGSAIITTGNRDADFAAACASVGLDADADSDSVSSADSGNAMTGSAGSVTDAAGQVRAGIDATLFNRLLRIIMHGTTRQVLSLITNPLDVMCANLQTVHGMMSARPDILGAHLEGPFLALSRKGAHDPECLKDPVPEYVDRLLQAAGGCLRQITIAPELPHGIDAIRRFAAAGVVPAVGHCDADYATARKGFDAGAGIMTHMFNAMNGLHHREPGPIPAAVEDPRVTIELINDGFHVQNPMVRLGFGFAPHRTAFVTDAMAATDCPDGHYLLGALDVDVIDGHARLVSNGAIAGSTLTLEKAVQRAVLELGFTPADAVEAATLTPAKAFGFDRANPVTKQPLGLLAPGYAADVLLLDPATWSVTHVWCDARPLR